MKNKIKPSQISQQFKWEVTAVTDFAADLLEDVNDHNIAAALRSLNAGNYDLACEFIVLEKEQFEAGEFTSDLRNRRNALLDRLKESSSQ